MSGHLYILKNAYMPGLVKIGFTERDPKARATELSSTTGVPGKYEIVSTWLVAEAATVERRIHLELAQYRKTGEFFELTPERAKGLVTEALRKWAVVGVDGLSFDARKICAIEQAAAESRRHAERVREDAIDFDMALEAIGDQIGQREGRLSAVARNATKPTGWFSLFRSSDTAERRIAIREAVEVARNSLAEDLGLRELFFAPPEVVCLSEDAYFLFDDKAAKRLTAAQNVQYKSPFGEFDPDTRHFLEQQTGTGHRRLPKGTTFESARGWKFQGRRLIHVSSGRSLDEAKPFSPKSPNKYGDSGGFGRHFSSEINLGAYHSQTLKIIVGEVLA